MPYVRTSRYRRRTNKRPSPKYGRKTRPMRRARRYSRRSAPSRYLRPRWENPLARSKSFKLVYNDDNFLGQCSVAQGYQALYLFRGNGPLDPDATGVGVQPYGWDQTIDVYSTCQVLASKITVYFSPNSECRDVKCFVFPYYDQTVAFKEPSDVRRIPGYKGTCWSTGGGTTKHNVVTNYGTNKLVYPDLTNTEYTYRSLVTALPTNQWYWVVMFDTSAAPDADATYEVYFDVKIVYYARMTTLENFDQS